MNFKLFSWFAVICLFFVETYGSDCLTEHNNHRANHGVQPLYYDATLEQFAISRARFMARTDIFGHPPNLQYGENLYWRYGRYPSCKDATDAWYNEIGIYNFNYPTFNTATGHFTQMVWADTQYMGCASAQSPRTGRVYIACNYYPQGNILGQFRRQVSYPRYWWYKK